MGLGGPYADQGRGRSDPASGMKEQRALPDANDRRQVRAAMALIEPDGGYGLQAVLDAVRVHGGCGHCTEYNVERHVDGASPVMAGKYQRDPAPASSSSVFRSPHDQPAR